MGLTCTPRQLFSPRLLTSLVGLWFAGLSGLAQTPTLLSSTPARHAVAAPRTTPVSATFSQPITAASAPNVRVFGSQSQGQVAGAVTGGGTATLTLTPGRAFAPGEAVSVSLPATLTGSNGLAAARQTFGFRVATGGAGRGFFQDTTEVGYSSTRDVLLGDVDNDGDLDLVSSGGIFQVLVQFNDGQGRFGPPVREIVAQEVGSMALADVNDDGYLDLLVSDLRNRCVAICLNDTRGRFLGTVFGGALTVTVGRYPSSVATGDVDGDGDLDFVSADMDDNTISVGRNAGRGNFLGVVTTLSMGTAPGTVALADVDQDGDLDVLTASNNSSSTVVLRLNDGRGTFGAARVVSSGEGGQELRLADFDGDGDVDLALTSVETTGSVTTTYLSWLRNDGTGNFGPRVRLASGPGYAARPLQVGDVDADGDLDLVASLGDSQTVITALNDGRGTFTAGAVPLALRGRQSFLIPRALGLGDADADGDLDLLVSDGNGRLVLGRNGLAPPPPTVAGFSPGAGQVGNRITLTGTGFSQVQRVLFGGVAAPADSLLVQAPTQLSTTVPAGAPSGPLSVVTPAGTGTSAAAFTVVVPVPVLSTSPSRNAGSVPRDAAVEARFAQAITAASAPALAVFGSQSRGRLTGPVSGGGSATLRRPPGAPWAPGELVSVSLPAALISPDGRPVAPQVVQFRVATGGTGQASFGPAGAASFTVSGVDILRSAVGDVDGDGDLDLVQGSRGFNATRGVELRRNLGAGAFGPGAAVAVPSGVPALGDVDGDGDLDLVVLAAPGPGAACAVRLNDGLGNFSGTGQVAVGASASELALGDLDGDGDLDLLLNGGRWLPNDGAGRFGAARPMAGVGVPVAADLDNDGDLDLIGAGSGGVSVALNQGGGRFGGATAWLPLPLPSAVAGDPLVGDFNGDGNLDVAVWTNDNDGVFVGLGNGRDGFRPAPANRRLPADRGLTLGDVDGDGDLDLLGLSLVGSSDARVSVSFNDGQGTFGPGLETRLTVDFLGQPTLADLDQDGDLDLLTTGGGGSTGVVFNQPLPAPAQLSAAPGSGPVGARVTLRGSNLVGTRRVTFNGVAAAFVVESPEQAYATVPAGASSGPLVLTAPGGTASVPFEVTTPIEVVSFSPGRNALSAPRDAAVEARFAQDITAASAPALAVFGSQRRGQLTGAVSGGGSATLRRQPAAPWAPGEVVSVSLPAGLRGGATGNAAVRPQTWQFTAATGGTGTGNLADTPVTLTPALGVYGAGSPTLAAADLNGDGRPDLLALANYTLTVALSTGPGTYGPGQSVNVIGGGQTAIFSLVTVDVDGDGDLDVVMARGNSYGYYPYGGDVVIGLNDGSGDVSNLVVATTRTGGAMMVTAGDFDADGDQDLATAGYGVDSIYVHLNDGQGSFAPGGRVAAPRLNYPIHRLLTVDVDNDGDLDLVSFGYYTPGQPPQATFSLNDGTGTFRPGGSYSLGSTTGWASSLAVGDVDGDGDVDLVPVLGSGVSGSGGNVALNDGRGNFSAGPALPPNLTSGVAWLTLADLDGDGDLDLSTVQSVAGNSQNRIPTWLNDGQGTFTAGAAPIVNSFNTGLTLADVDGDGDLDAVAMLLGNNPAAGFVAYLNRPAGPRISAFTPASGGAGTVVTITGQYFTGATQVRVGGVSLPFTLVSDTQLTLTITPDAIAGPLAVTTPNGTATSATPFALPPPTLTAFAPASGAVGRLVTVTGTWLRGTSAVRFNGTVAPQFTVVSATQLTAVVPAGATTGPLTLTTPSGSATSAGPFTVLPTPGAVVLSPAPQTLAAAPTAPVQLTLSNVVPGVPAGAVRVFGSLRQGQRAGTWSGAGTTRLTFTPSQPAAPGEQVSVSLTGALRDANGDSLRARVYQYLTATGGPGRGVFTPGPPVAVDNTPVAALTGDVDGDGDLDLISLDDNVSAYSSRRASVRLNDGTGRFAGTGSLSLGPPLPNNFAAINCTQLLLADIDNDGDLDLLAFFEETRSFVHILLNSGTGRFSQGPVLVPANFADPRRMAVGDLNADGRLDVLLSTDGGSMGANLMAFLNAGNGGFTPGLASGQDGESSNLVLGDVDGDGDLDALTTAPPTYGLDGTVMLCLNDGRGRFAFSRRLQLSHAAGRITLGDVDGDGDLDLVTATATYNNTVKVWLNSGQGVFSATSDVLFGRDTAAGSLVLGDVDADGDLDLLIGGFPTGAGALGINQGGGRFAALVALPASGSSGDLALADFDGDGSLDLAAPGPNALVVYRNATGNPLATAPPAAAGRGLQVYPQPARGSLTVVRPAGPGVAGTLTLHDALGRLVYQQALPAGLAPVRVAVPGLAPGLYALRLLTDQGIFQQQVVLE